MEYHRLRDSTWAYMLDTYGWKANAFPGDIPSFEVFVRMVTPLGPPPAVDKRKSRRKNALAEFECVNNNLFGTPTPLPPRRLFLTS